MDTDAHVGNYARYQTRVGTTMDSRQSHHLRIAIAANFKKLNAIRIADCSSCTTPTVAIMGHCIAD